MSKDLVNSLDYLHNFHNIVHRDIKPQNILLNEGFSTVLADFGKSKKLESNEDDITSSIEGT